MELWRWKLSKTWVIPIHTIGRIELGWFRRRIWCIPLANWALASNSYLNWGCEARPPTSNLRRKWWSNCYFATVLLLWSNSNVMSRYTSEKSRQFLKSSHLSLNEGHLAPAEYCSWPPIVGVPPSFIGPFATNRLFWVDSSSAREYESTIHTTNAREFLDESNHSAEVISRDTTGSWPRLPHPLILYLSSSQPIGDYRKSKLHYTVYDGCIVFNYFPSAVLVKFIVFYWICALISALFTMNILSNSILARSGFYIRFDILLIDYSSEYCIYLNAFLQIVIFS